MNKRKYIFLGIIVFSIAIIVFTFLGKTYALSKYGSTGSEV